MLKEFKPVSVFQAYRRFDEVDHKAVLEKFLDCGAEEVLSRMDSILCDMEPGDVFKTEPAVKPGVDLSKHVESDSKRKSCRSQVMGAVLADAIVPAIKVLRGDYGIGLKEAKDVVDILKGSEYQIGLGSLQPICRAILMEFLNDGFVPLEIKKTPPAPAVIPFRSRYVYALVSNWIEDGEPRTSIHDSFTSMGDAEALMDSMQAQAKFDGDERSNLTFNVRSVWVSVGNVND